MSPELGKEEGLASPELGKEEGLASLELGHSTWAVKLKQRQPMLPPQMTEDLSPSPCIL